MMALARARYLTEPLLPSQQRPSLFDAAIIDSLPTEIRSLTGTVRSLRPLKQGASNLVLTVEAEHGTFVLKVARGGYRSQELRAEHAAMQFLDGSPVPVPRSLAYLRCEDLSFQLRAYCPGQPMSRLLDADAPTGLDAVRRLGSLLSGLHALRLAETWTWEEWLDASLAQAARSLAAGVCDPDEFTPDDPPEAVLDRLLANRPAKGGPVCLLHGDYRPKNVLWDGGRITGVIDWAFVDVGDPYYDLGIIRWYMRDETEWHQFLEAYGIGELDAERFRYCEALQKFLNV